MDLAGKKTVVIGLGKSGVSSARFLADENALVTVTDMSDEKKLASEIKSLSGYPIRFELGFHDSQTFLDADLLVISPGVPHTIKPVTDAVKKGVPLMGEIEFAARFIKKPIIAITGTNGKSTVTALIGDMLQQSGIRPAVCGNIGIPLTDFIRNSNEYDMVVLEVSSFQLDTISAFKPHISLLLNISDDHLDRYLDIHEYADSKANIFKNQTEHDVAILNAGDTLSQNLMKNIKTSLLTFGHRTHGNSDAIIDTKNITLYEGSTECMEIDVTESLLKGPHNRENIAASALAALKAGATPDGIQRAINTFHSLPHRIEFVETIHGVSFYDDSKGTNADSVLKAVESFDHLILIMGGREKDCNYSILKDAVRKRVKKLILLGEARENIQKELGDSADIILADNMDEAVQVSKQLAVKGDTVLLSPACTSFDMFKNYSDRGNAFKKAVRALTGRA